MLVVTRFLETSNRENYGFKEVDFANDLDPDWLKNHPEDARDGLPPLPQPETFCGVEVWDDEQHEKEVLYAKRDEIERKIQSIRRRELKARQEQKRKEKLTESIVVLENKK